MRGIRKVERRRPRRRDERGIVVVYFAMFLVVLMISSAFVVDMGSWYVRQKQLQRAADAAALAAAAYLPGISQAAIDEAHKAALANGIDYTNVSTPMTVTADPNSDGRVDVTITDTNVKRYFSKTFMSGAQTLTATAVGEYLPKLKLGTPINIAGSGFLGDDTHQMNVWGGVAGWCTPKESGDRYLTHADSEYVNGAWDCSAGTANTEYNGLGNHWYTYQVEVPAARKGSDSIVIEAFDPSYDPYWYLANGTSTASCNYDTSGANLPDPDYQYTTPRNSYAITTHFDVYDPDGVLLQPNQFSSIESGFLGSGGHGDSTHCGWNTLATLPNTTPAGTYTVRVSTDEGQQNSFGVNAFAIEARYSSQTAPLYNNAGNSVCSSDQGIANYTYQAYCINVHSQDAMTAFTWTGHSLKGTSTFYLAKLAAAYAGKTMTITLWDPGDSMTAPNNLQIINPKGGTAATFDWTVAAGGHCGAAPLCSATGVTGIDTSGSTTDPPNPNLQSSSMFNDRLITMTVPIPANYNPASTADQWWKLKYSFDGTTNVSDMTTWTVTISGSPIHLVYH